MSTSLDPAAAAFLKELADAQAPPLTAGSPSDARANNAAFLSEVGMDGPDIQFVDDITIPTTTGSVSGRRYRATERPAGVMVYLHGGGWVIGDLDSLDGLCRLLAAKADLEVISVDYRLAPEHRFPAGLDDAYDALRWASMNAEGRPVCVGGDSSGGNLAAAAALKARDEGGPELALQLLLYPVVDHDFTSASYIEFADGHLLTRNDMEWFWNHYLPEADERDHPHASPLRCDDLSGVAAAYVAVAGFDPLRDEGLAYAERLQAAGVPVTCKNFASLLHGFVSIPKVIPAGGAAAEEICADVAQLVRST
jgi:acetyl esterase